MTELISLNGIKVDEIRTEFNISFGGWSGKADKKAVEQLMEAFANERVAHASTTARLAEVTGARNTIKDHSDKLESRLNSVRELTGQTESELWLRKPLGQPLNYAARLQRSIPIMVFANLKGGVAKTTLSANIASYFEHKHGERVLAIDLDFQGSLTSMLRDASAANGSYAHSAISVLSDKFNPDELLTRAPQIRDSKRDSRFISCGQEFANYESALLLQWVIGDVQADIRYLLANVLLSDAVQKNFDRVIIDAPPRTSTGFVNALCASTHLFIPTVLDQLSTDGVKSFLTDFDKLQPVLFPVLKLVGILGTMKRNSGETFDKSEETALKSLRDDLTKRFGSDHHLWQDQIMPRMQEFARTAGVSVAYPKEAGVRLIVETLGEKIAERAMKRAKI
jgi:cellulose biosynthesis protein BcsQ